MGASGDLFPGRGVWGAAPPDRASGQSLEVLRVHEDMFDPLLVLALAPGDRDDQPRGELALVLFFLLRSDDRLHAEGCHAGQDQLSGLVPQLGGVDLGDVLLR